MNGLVGGLFWWQILGQGPLPSEIRPCKAGQSYLTNSAAQLLRHSVIFMLMRELHTLMYRPICRCHRQHGKYSRRTVIVRVGLNKKNVCEHCPM